MRSRFLLFFSVVLWLACASACKKEDPKLGTIHVKLTDAPADLTSVNLDIKSVHVHSNESHPLADWVELPTNSGVYDVLKLNNGIDALIATGEFPCGPVHTVRIELGTNNTVVAGGVTYPLNIRSGIKPELVVEMSDMLKEGEERTLLIDFDVQKSIKFKGDGYELTPVIHAIDMEKSGTIKGKVTPGWTYPVVYAIAGRDTTTAYPNGDGDFLMRGINPGVYSVVVQPREPYQVATVPNVVVHEKQVKDVGIIEVH